MFIPRSPELRLAFTPVDYGRVVGDMVRIPDQGGLHPVVALIAHDQKRDDLLRLVRAHRPLLAGLRLLATGTTGGLLVRELGLSVERVASGPEGGDLQIGARIVEGCVDAVIFLRDPLTAHPHEPDIQALLKVCDTHGVPVATNVSSAEILLHFLADLTLQLAGPGRPEAG